MVQSQIGSNLNMHLTSSTCVMGQRRHGLSMPRPWLSKSLDEIYAALSRNLQYIEEQA